MESFDNITQHFPAITPELWKAKIVADLKGKSFDQLISEVDAGIEVLPFYTKEDNARHQLNIPARQNTGWLITERIIVADLQQANQQALDALQMGANAIVFDLQNKIYSATSIQQLQEGILTDIAPVFFENLPGIVSVISIPKQQYAVEELVVALQEGLQNNFSCTKFQFTVGTDYFLEIAKLRAFRWLWKQLCMLKDKPFELFVFSDSLGKDMSSGNEYDNMLRNTTEAMSAILGGCDALIINSHEVGVSVTDFGRRIARNIHHILQHESYFNDAEDAVKGSYYAEYLTYQLAQKAWERFRYEGEF